jgi:urea carboxylase
MTGQTIPCFDQLGVKPDFSPSQPGLFRDFDQITFYRVDKEELERDMARFRAGYYKFQYEEVNFDMSAHNRLLEQTKDEVAAFKSRQATSQVKMLALEMESMDRWMVEKAQNNVPTDEIELLKEGEPNITQRTKQFGTLTEDRQTLTSSRCTLLSMQMCGKSTLQMVVWFHLLKLLPSLRP